MKKTGITLQAGASVVQGPRGKNLEFIWKNTQLGIRTEGDTEYDYVDLQGQQGIRGIQGNKGDTGNGIDKIENIFFSDKTKTYRITFTNGSFFDFSVENGENVYDIALDNGFEGTEEEWLESLIGKGLEFNWNGTQLGVRVEGETSYNYVNLKGEKGDIGLTGAKGDKGPKGDTGPAGLQGEKGVQGPKGDKGDKGDIGPAGTTTWTGITGKPSTFTPSSHTHDERYFTEPEIEEKFKNFCPYSIGDIYITTLSINPATRFLGTTWEKIEGRFLLATSGSNASGQTGGSNTKTISKANLPNIKLQVDTFSLTIGPPDIELYNNYAGNSESGRSTLSTTGEASKAGWSKSYIRINSGGSTGTASPYTSALGSGTALDITPSFYTVHIWKRLT